MIQNTVLFYYFIFFMLVINAESLAKRTISFSNKFHQFPVAVSLLC